jgi:hypothetical protein
METEFIDTDLNNKSNSLKELEDTSWEYRIFSTVNSKKEKRFGLKKVFLKDGKIIDFDKRFILKPVFLSSKELKSGLDTMLRDLSETREGSMVLEQRPLHKLLKEKGTVDVIEDIYYG